jgi:hypothetical protein
MPRRPIAIPTVTSGCVPCRKLLRDERQSVAADIHWLAALGHRNALALGQVAVPMRVRKSR